MAVKMTTMETRLLFAGSIINIHPEVDRLFVVGAGRKGGAGRCCVLYLLSKKKNAKSLLSNEIFCATKRY